MDKRAARREAHSWVAAALNGGLNNGLLGELDYADDADEDRVRAEIQAIADRHHRLSRGTRRTARANLAINEED